MLEDCRSLLGFFGDIKIRFVSKTTNICTDKIAKDAVQSLSWQEWLHPPPILCNILIIDLE